MSHQVYLFHPVHGTKLIQSEQEQSHLDEGWYDSPLKFPSKSVEPPKGEKEPEIPPKAQGKPKAAKEKKDPEVAKNGSEPKSDVA